MGPNIKCPLQVPVLDGKPFKRVTLTYKQAVANWLKNQRPYQALDHSDIGLGRRHGLSYVPNRDCPSINEHTTHRVYD